MECGLVRETRFVEEKNRGPRSLKFFRISFKSYVSASQKKKRYLQFVVWFHKLK